MSSATSPHFSDLHPPTSERQGGLQMSVRQLRGAVELRLDGDLDRASAPQLLAAMRWIRRRTRRVVVIDTRGLDFVDLLGYRAFNACLEDLSGKRDPSVVYLVGDALAHVRKAFTAMTNRASPRLS